MRTESRTTDAEARLTLPETFANTTVIVEQVSDTELRIRLAEAVAVDELPFAEETATPLSDCDRDRFLELLADPPSPTPALNGAAIRHKGRRG